LIGRVQRTTAVGAAEASFVEYSAFADHLFGSEDGVTASLATLSGGGKGTAVGTRIVDDGGNSVGGH